MKTIKTVDEIDIVLTETTRPSNVGFLISVLGIAFGVIAIGMIVFTRSMLPLGILIIGICLFISGLVIMLVWNIPCWEIRVYDGHGYQSTYVTKAKSFSQDRDNIRDAVKKMEPIARAIAKRRSDESRLAKCAATSEDC